MLRKALDFLIKLTIDLTIGLIINFLKIMDFSKDELAQVEEKLRDYPEITVACVCFIAWAIYSYNEEFFRKLQKKIKEWLKKKSNF